MDRFDRVSLSPLRVAEEPAELPSSLSWEDLAGVLVDLDVDRLSECRAFKRYEIQGLRDRAQSVVLSVNYPTLDGCVVLDMFVKRTPRTAREVERHAQLTAAGVHVPRLLCDIELSDGDHVLGFEFLDTIGIDFTSADEIAELLTLVATLNAVSPSALGESPSPPGGRPEAEFTASVETALMAARSAGLLSWAPLMIEDWLDLYRDAKRWAQEMPVAVTHGEMYFQQVGRAGTGPLVIFDLATVGLRPRFFDICSLTRGLTDRGGDETALLEWYMDALRAAGATGPTVIDGIHELRWLRILSAFQSLLSIPRLGGHPR